jgi:hypothetical protein
MPVDTPVRGRTVSPARSGGYARPAARRVNGLRITTLILLGLCVVFDTGLLLVSVIPQSIWAAHGYPNGPIPAKLAPVVAALFYLLPSVVGALCRRWIPAVVLATLPAWVDLGVFSIAAAWRDGPFYLGQDVHATSTVGTLELFAALGALGYLARTAVLALFGRGEWRLR